MIYKKSHNDYWVKNKILEAIKNDCKIIETDIICIGNSLMNSHSWRPFKFLCYGNLESYLFAIGYLNWKEQKNIYLQIEIKENSEKIFKKLYLLLKQYNSVMNGKVIISANDKTKEKAKLFYNIFKNELGLLWLESNSEFPGNPEIKIESVDLYKKRWLHF